MNRKYFTLYTITCLVFHLTIMSAQADQASTNDLPVAPVKASVFQGWSNAYCIANPSITVAAVPAIGRIIHIGPDKTKNLLTFREEFCNQLPDEASADWTNYGGDWLFPVSQKRWPTFQNGDWPPSRLLDGRPWTGRAWQNADGTQCCLLQQEYGDPLHIKISRLIKVPPQGAVMTIEQRIERLKESSIPVTLWNISQIANPQYTAFPSDSAFTNGYLMMMGTPPPTEQLTLCDDTLVFDADHPDQVKFGSGSTQRWVTAVAQNCIITEKAASSITSGSFPDGGCAIEVYANKGLGYAEIENLSMEKSLNPGETMANILTITLTDAPDTITNACELAQTIQTIVCPPTAAETPPGIASPK